MTNDLARAALHWISTDPANIDLTIRQFAIIGIMADGEAERWTVPELAARIGATKPVISRMMSALSERGWIIRETDPDDGRGAFFKLAKHGKRARERMKGVQDGE